jgi:hypothetical protein
MGIMVACACTRVDQAEMQWDLGARPHHDKPWNLEYLRKEAPGCEATQLPQEVGLSSCLK